MVNPYEPSKTFEVGDPQLGPAVGKSFYFSLVLAVLLFFFVPMFPLTFFIAVVGTIWGLGGIVLSWLNVRGPGRFAAMSVSAFYAFILFVTWRNLLHWM